MPSDTFLKLAKPKQDRFLEAAFEEFSENNFETASINRIIKKAGISRGSVYQYFEDKLDLWKYLKTHVETCKLSYVKNINRADYDSFWDFYRALYIEGIAFDLEHPVYSRFLYQVAYKETSKELLPLIDGWKDQAKEVYATWVAQEQESGSINPNLDIATTVHFMLTVSMSITTLIQDKYKVDIEQQIKDKKTVFAHDIKSYKAAVNDIITLLEKALK